MPAEGSRRVRSRGQVRSTGAQVFLLDDLCLVLPCRMKAVHSVGCQRGRGCRGQVGRQYKVGDDKGEGPLERPQEQGLSGPNYKRN